MDVEGVSGDDLDEVDDDDKEVDDDDDDDDADAAADVLTHPFRASAKFHGEKTGSVFGFFGWLLMKSINLSFLLPYKSQRVWTEEHSIAAPEEVMVGQGCRYMRKRRERRERGRNK